MKMLLAALLFCATLFGYASDPGPRSNVCLNMIVKNEAHVIERCFDSVLPLIDSWVIVDTGSTDGTQEIIRNYMAKKNIPGTLYERPWINFSHNRNEALQLGRPTADYLLFMDADDILIYQPQNYKRESLLNKDAYYMKIDYSGTLYYRMQLVSTSKEFRWIGAVHEVIISDEARDLALLEGVTMKIIGGGGRSKNTNKFLKDIQMLKAELEKDPTNARDTFYLAQSYRDAEMFEEAIEWYEKRASMGGWDEEVFWSLYQIGIIQERMLFPPDVTIASYYRAFNYRPSRAEPLYRIVSLQRRNSRPYHALLMANLGLHIPLPNDLIFVESWIYDFGFLFESSLCCYALKLYQQAFDISLKLLAMPNLPEELRNLVEHNLQPIIHGMSQSNRAA